MFPSKPNHENQGSHGYQVPPLTTSDRLRPPPHQDPALDTEALNLPTHPSLIDAAPSSSFQNVNLPPPQTSATQDTLLEEVAFHALESGLAQGRTLQPERVQLHQDALAALRVKAAVVTPDPLAFQRRFDALLEREEQRGIRMRLDADKVAMTISIGLRRIIPDCATLYDVLDGKTALELTLIREAFHQRYEEPIEQFVQRTLSRPWLRFIIPAEASKNRALHLLRGERAEAAVDTIYLALVHPFRKPFHTIVETLRKCEPEELAQIPDLFLRNYDTKLVKLVKLLSAFSPIEQQAIEALLQGKRLDAEVFLIERGLLGPARRYDRVFETLERLGPKRLPEIVGCFETYFPTTSFRQAVSSMKPGPGRDRALAFIDRDDGRFDAAVVRCAIERIGSLNLKDLFRAHDRPGRRALVKAYEATYGRSFWDDVWSKRRRAEYFAITEVYRHGSVPKAHQLWCCVRGLGTDEQGIKNILNGLTKQEIDQLAIEYANLQRQRGFFKRPGNLERRLRWETSGDAWYDVKRLLSGVPSNTAAMYQRLLTHHAHERSGALIYRVDLLTREGAVMDRDVASARAFYQSAIAGNEPQPAERVRFETLVRFCHRSFQGFRVAKNDISDVFANVASGVVAFSTALPTAFMIAGVLPPAQSIAIIAAVAATSRAVTRLGLKFALKGAGYGREEVARDLIVSTLEGSTFFLSKFLPLSLLQRPLDFGAKMGLRRMVRFGETSDTQRLAAHAMTLRNLHSDVDVEVRAQNRQESTLRPPQTAAEAHP